MKKIMVVALALAALVACNNESGEKKPEAGGTDLSSNPVYKEGLALVGKNNCISCHKVDAAVTGPSYRDVAEKYAGAGPETVTALAKKVIEGGAGVWGSVPMTPNSWVSQEDAEKMVRYILLLKK
jgi:cytochrome c